MLEGDNRKAGRVACHEHLDDLAELLETAEHHLFSGIERDVADVNTESIFETVAVGKGLRGTAARTMALAGAGARLGTLALATAAARL